MLDYRDLFRLTQEHTKEIVEELAVKYGVWDNHKSRGVMYKGKYEYVLANPVLVDAVALKLPSAYFLFASDITNYILSCVALCGDTNYSSYLRFYELMGDVYVTGLNKEEDDIVDYLSSTYESMKMGGHRVFKYTKPCTIIPCLA